MLRSIFRKMAGIKELVQKGSNYDKINIADDIKERSPLVKNVVARNSRIFVNQVLGEDISMMPEEVDLNKQATLAIQDLVFTSVAANPAANLITIVVLSDAAEAIVVEDNHIEITIEAAVSDMDAIKALVDGDSQAAALVTVAVGAGQGAVVVIAEAIQDMSGAI